MPNAQLLNPDRVAVYIRTARYEHGVPTAEEQIRACKQYLTKKGQRLKSDFLFVDEGQSGKTLDRPAMKKLRETVKEGKVSSVVVWRLDRLSRSLFDCVCLVRSEWAGKCGVVSVSEDFHTGGPSGERLFDVLQNFLADESPEDDLLNLVLAAGGQKKRR